MRVLHFVREGTEDDAAESFDCPKLSTEFGVSSPAAPMAEAS